MKPDEFNSNQDGLTLSQQGINNSTQKLANEKIQKEAATNIIRSQIDNLFKEQTDDTNQIETINNSQSFEVESPYDKTHTRHISPQVNEWNKYHTAWQNYYQKYYEDYYNHKVEETTQNNKLNHATKSNSSRDEAIFDLRQKLIEKVQSSALTVKKSRHFIPLISGLIVVLIFAFLQYNRVIFANVTAYVSPGNIDIQNIIIDPNTNLEVPPESKIIIPKINVDVPVSYDVGNDYKSQMAAMTTGLAHFSTPGASSHPGEIGNTVIAGHSSNDLIETGDYKFIFVQLDKLNTGDTIYANYQSKRYTYTVTRKEVVKPNEVNKLVYPTDKPILTLITCTPIGTALNRLLVVAEQVSPDPVQSVAAPITTESTGTSSIPGNPPTFFERLFGNNK